MSAVLAAPAAVRVFLAFASGYFMSYGLRSVNAVIAPDLIAEFGLTNAQLGSLSSAYFLAFASVQVPLGVLLDRFGSPCEERLWADTFVRVPFAVTGQRFVEVFTGRRLELTEHEGYSGLFLRDALSGFPVFLAIPEEQAEVG